MSMNNIISQNLRRIRLAKGLSQQKVADGAGISRIAYRNIENYGAEPKVNTLINIAKALDVRLLDVVEKPRKLTKVKFN